MSTTSRKSFTFVTSNLKKLAEVRNILPDFQIDHANLDLREIQGDHIQIAVDKCLNAFKILKTSVIVDDTSLRFKALGNDLPGPYVKYFVEAIGPHGLCKLLTGFEDKRAEAVCVFAYIHKDADPIEDSVKIFKGVCEGVIVEPRCGDKESFGWDPCFQSNDHNKTFAEMKFEEKNAISHRSRALQALKEYFNS